MFNILQTRKDGATQLMLGMSVEDRAVAQEHCDRYINKLPECNRGRVANGYPPLNVTYQVVEVNCDRAGWWNDDLEEFAAMLQPPHRCPSP